MSSLSETTVFSWFQVFFPTLNIHLEQDGGDRESPHSGPFVPGPVSCSRCGESSAHGVRVRGPSVKRCLRIRFHRGLVGVRPRQRQLGARGASSTERPAGVPGGPAGLRSAPRPPGLPPRKPPRLPHPASRTTPTWPGRFGAGRPPREARLLTVPAAQLTESPTGRGPGSFLLQVPHGLSHTVGICEHEIQCSLKISRKVKCLKSF